MTGTRDLRIQSFVFTWRGQERGAVALEDALRSRTRVTVINSDPSVESAHPEWVHIGESAYFSAQWNRAIELFDGDVMFHVQADARSDRWGEVLTRAERMFRTHRIGVYEPNLDYTEVRYDTTRLRELERALFEIPWTDCTCWFVAGEIVRLFRPVDLSINRYGWGICRVIAALSHMHGRASVRDYSFTIDHPKGRGYPNNEAYRQARAYLTGLEPEIKAELSLMHQSAAEVFIPVGKEASA